MAVTSGSRPSAGLNGFHLTPDGPKACNVTIGSCPYPQHYKTIGEADKAWSESQRRDERTAASIATPMTLNKSRRPMPSPASIGSKMVRPIARDGKPMSESDMVGATNVISDGITDADWEMVQSVAGDLETVVNRGRSRSRNLRRQYGADDPKTKKAMKDLHDRVTGIIMDAHDPRMAALRRYIGDGVSASDLADLIIAAPKGMYGRTTLDDDTVGVARLIFSNTGNDMANDRRKVIATVLFFGGRCCYCGRPVRKCVGGVKNPDTATADHLDPVDPEDRNDVPGETKFGNTALCCYECNQKKKSQSLDKFISTSDVFTKPDGTDDKDGRRHAKERIAAFREFTNYDKHRFDAAQGIAAIHERNGLKSVTRQWIRHDRETGEFPSQEELDKRNAKLQRYLDGAIRRIQLVRGMNPSDVENEYAEAKKARAERRARREVSESSASVGKVGLSKKRIDSDRRRLSGIRSSDANEDRNDSAGSNDAGNVSETSSRNGNSHKGNDRPRRRSSGRPNRVSNRDDNASMRKHSPHDEEHKESPAPDGGGRRLRRHRKWNSDGRNSENMQKSSGTAHA